MTDSNHKVDFIMTNVAYMCGSMLSNIVLKPSKSWGNSFANEA